MKRILNVFSIASLIVLSLLAFSLAPSSKAWAKSFPQLVASHEPTVERIPEKGYRRSILTLPSGSLYFDINFQKNESDTLEMIVSLIESRRGMPDTKIPVIYGRDINSDNKMDIWLIPDEDHGINGLYRPSLQLDGWDVLPDILIRQAHIERRSVGKLLYNVLSTSLSFALLKQESFFSELLKQQMDIVDLELRIEQLKKKGVPVRNLIPFYELASQGWNDILEKLNREIYIESTLAVVDGLTFVLIPKGVAKIGSKIANAQKKIYFKLAPKFSKVFHNISEKELSRNVARLYNSFSRGVSETAHRSIEQINKYTLHLAPTATHAVAKLIQMSVSKQTQLTLKALNAQNFLVKKAWETLSTSLLLVNEGIIRLPYVAQTLGVQVVAELITRKEAMASGNPIIVKQNMKEMGQNMGYMSTETLMQASISSALSNVNKRMSICAVLSLNNSIGASLVLNGEPDPARQAFDTRWEVLVGNLQTQVDIEALKLFSKLSDKAHNPKLKLVGYAVALADQFTGYIMYSLATQKISQYQKSESPRALNPQLVLMPIMVDTTDIPPLD